LPTRQLADQKQTLHNVHWSQLFVKGVSSLSTAGPLSAFKSCSAAAAQHRCLACYPGAANGCQFSSHIALSWAYRFNSAAAAVWLSAVKYAVAVLAGLPSFCVVLASQGKQSQHHQTSTGLLQYHLQPCTDCGSAHASTLPCQVRCCFSRWPW
jgi:hypothetical protein